MNEFELELELENVPHTRKTLLTEENYKSLTEVTKLTTKLYKLCKRKKVGRGSLVGKHRGETIFFSLNKKYTIIVVKTCCGMKYYYCKKMKDNVFGQIKLHDCYELQDFSWNYVGDKDLIRNNIVEYY